MESAKAKPARLHRNTSANTSVREKITTSSSIMVSSGTGKRKTDHRLAWLPRWLGTGQIGIVSLDAPQNWEMAYTNRDKEMATHTMAPDSIRSESSCFMVWIISDKGAIGNQPGTNFSHSLGYLLTDGWVVSHDTSQHGLKVAAGEGVALRGRGIGILGLEAGGQHGDQVGCLKAGFGLSGDGCHGRGPLLRCMDWSIQGAGRNGKRFRQIGGGVAGIQQLKGWRAVP